MGQASVEGTRFVSGFNQTAVAIGLIATAVLGALDFFTPLAFSSENDDHRKTSDKTDTGERRNPPSPRPSQSEQKPRESSGTYSIRPNSEERVSVPSTMSRPPSQTPPAPMSAQPAVAPPAALKSNGPTQKSPSAPDCASHLERNASDNDAHRLRATRPIVTARSSATSSAPSTKNDADAVPELLRRNAHEASRLAGNHVFLIYFEPQAHSSEPARSSLTPQAQTRRGILRGKFLLSQVVARGPLDYTDAFCILKKENGEVTFVPIKDIIKIDLIEVWGKQQGTEIASAVSVSPSLGSPPPRPKPSPEDLTLFAQQDKETDNGTDAEITIFEDTDPHIDLTEMQNQMATGITFTKSELAIIGNYLNADWLPKQKPLTETPPTPNDIYWEDTWNGSNALFARAIEAHNRAMLRINQRRTLAAIHGLAGSTLSDALPEIYRHMFTGHIPQFGRYVQGDPSVDLYTAEGIAKIRQDGMRHGWSQTIAIVLNLLTLHPLHLEEVLNALSQKLENHFDQISVDIATGNMNPQNAYRSLLSLASWAQYMITLIQPGVDCNTRSARQVFHWVIERGKLLNPLMENLMVDISTEQARKLQLPFEFSFAGMNHGLFAPFSDDLKDLINLQTIDGLLEYTHSQLRRTGENKRFLIYKPLSSTYFSGPLLLDPRIKPYIIELENRNTEEVINETTPNTNLSKEEWSQLDERVKAANANYLYYSNAIMHGKDEHGLPVQDIEGIRTQRDFLLHLINRSTIQSINDSANIKAQVNWLLTQFRMAGGRIPAVWQTKAYGIPRPFLDPTK